MKLPSSRLALLILVLVAALSLSPDRQLSAQDSSTATPAAPTLKIGGAVSTPLTLSVADLKGMPRTTVRVENPHDKKTETYEGVLVEELLRKAGAPHGEQLRGPLMTSYVVAEGND